MGFVFHYSAEVLAGQGEMGVRVDMPRQLWYRSKLSDWSNACPFVVYPSGPRRLSDSRGSAFVCLAVVLGFL
jgi:hypothetical protein